MISAEKSNVLIVSALRVAVGLHLLPVSAIRGKNCTFPIGLNFYLL